MAFEEQDLVEIDGCSGWGNNDWSVTLTPLGRAVAGLGQE